MTSEEFKSRTEKFLSEAEIDRYEEWFEPAYMATSGIDKDDFCKILKLPIARTFVREVSIAISDHHERMKDLESRYMEERGLRHDAEETSAKYRKALSLISATCDRTGATAT